MRNAVVIALLFVYVLRAVVKDGEVMCYSGWRAIIQAITAIALILLFTH